MTTKTYKVGESSPELIVPTPSGVVLPAQTLAQAMAAQTAALKQQIAAARNAVWNQQPTLLTKMRLYDYAHQPPHPDDWIPVPTRDLDDGEVHEVADWLWMMSGGRWNIVTHYTPALRQLVYFERSQDAAMFKLAWGGEV